MKKSLGVLLAGLLLTFAFSLFTPLADATPNSWSESYNYESDEEYEYILSLAEFDNKLYAGTSPDGIILVYDGDNWSISENTDEDDIHSLAVYEGKLYAGTSSPGMIYYTSDGNTWENTNEIPETDIHSLAVYGENLYAGTGSQGKIYTYDGSTWALSKETGDTRVYSLAVYDNKLYAGTGYNGLVFAYDGDNWSPVNNFPGLRIFSLVEFDNKLYAGTYYGGVIYTYSGNGWTSYNLAQDSVNSLAVYSGKLYAGTSSLTGKIFYTSNGTTWTKSYEDDIETDINALAIYGDNLYAGTGSNGLILTFKEVPFDFSISASPDNVTLMRSDSITSTITVSLVSGTAETVSLSGSDWVGTEPTGVSASFSQSSGNPPFSSILTFTTTSTASAGTFTYGVTGTDGGLTRTDNITVTIVAPPTAPSLVSPENGTALDTLTPTFDWSDVAGATSYTLWIATDSNFSDPFEKSAAVSTVTLSETEELSYGTRYYWRVRGTNAAGSGDWSPTWNFKAKLTPPIVTSFAIEAGDAYTSDNTVQLTTTAQNAVEMRFSDDREEWSEWEPYQTSKSYTLSGLDGSKKIYIRVKDNAGDISESESDSIILDQTPPNTQKDLSGDLRAEGYKNSVVVTLTATDATSGVSSTKYRVDGGEWKTGDTFVISTDGTHTVEYYSTDAAWNTEGTRTFEVTVYTPTAIPPILSQYWWAILSIIVGAGVVSVFATRRVRLSGRLKRITREKEEILKLKREAEVKYFRDGSISRDTFDALIKDYERRKAELEKEERVLRGKVKRKVKGAES